MIFRYAEENKVNPTYEEILLKEKLDSYDKTMFFSQYVIKSYIIDFYNIETKTAIEIDGKYHNSEDQKYKDKNRTKVLEKDGIKVIRFTNWIIANDIDKALNKIFYTIWERLGNKKKPKWLKKYVKKYRKKEIKKSGWQPKCCNKLWPAYYEYCPCCGTALS